MLFEVSGPFEITRHGKKKLIEKKSTKDLINVLDQNILGLSTAHGCYVFSIKAGKGFTPYYVGQARSQTMVKEALNADNIGKYNGACSDSKGTPVIFFLPMVTPSGKYRKASKPRLPFLDFLERWLISEAINKNQDLINNKETKFLRSIHVPGLFNSKQGEASKSSRLLRKALS
jgi:hypothetical protein